MRRMIVAAGIVAGWCLAGAVPDPDSSRAAAPSSAVEAVLDEFSRAPLVAVAERHRSRAFHEFLLALLAHPKFPSCVDDIVVECGSARYQPIIDRYVAGGDVPQGELQQVWRGTTQFLVWDSPVYERFFAAVRRLNATLPEADRVRVLLGDPPIHWPDVKTAADYRAFADRDAFYASVVEKEVLSKGRRALLIVGSEHVKRRGPTDPSVPKMDPGVGEILSRGRPGQLRVIWTLPPSAELAAKLEIRSAPEFVRLDASELGRRSFALLAPPGVLVRRVVDGVAQWTPMGEVAWPPMSEVVDALLYLGSDDASVDPDPSIYADPAYQTELRRRAPILDAVYGFEFLPQLEELLRPGSAK